MRPILILSLFILLATISFGKGCSGTYTLHGIAYGSDKQRLKNASLMITVGKDVRTIQTDAEGHYEIEIPWVHDCPSMKSKEQWKKNTKLANPALIFTFDEQHIALKNYWRRFDKCGKEGGKKRKNLRF